MQYGQRKLCGHMYTSHTRIPMPGLHVAPPEYVFQAKLIQSGLDLPENRVGSFALYGLQDVYSNPNVIGPPSCIQHGRHDLWFWYTIIETELIQPLLQIPGIDVRLVEVFHPEVWIIVLVTVLRLPMTISTPNCAVHCYRT